MDSKPLLKNNIALVVHIFLIAHRKQLLTLLEPALPEVALPKSQAMETKGFDLPSM